MLHHTAGALKEEGFENVNAHFVITPNGRILQLYPLEIVLWASHGFNNRSVAVEFVGNFRNEKHICWFEGPCFFTCSNTPTPAQIQAGRDLIIHLRSKINLTHIFAHRQSGSQRESDPGPDIWYHVGQWAIDKFKLNDGGQGYFLLDNSYAIKNPDGSFAYPCRLLRESWINARDSALKAPNDPNSAKLIAGIPSDCRGKAIPDAWRRQMPQDSPASDPRNARLVGGRPEKCKYVPLSSRYQTTASTSIKELEPARFELNDEVSSWENPSLPAALRQAMRTPTAQALSGYAAQSIQLTAANALAILRSICSYYGIPWRVAYTLLQHEGGIRLFTHHDGVMQTTLGARNAIIPLIPRVLKLGLLGRSLADITTSERDLTAAIKSEFPRSLPIQIAVGVQELMTNLERFNGYVALAYQAYNAGSGWAYYTVTAGARKTRPANVTAAQWEDMCRIGAAILHQSPSSVRINDGVWQCDANIPTWFSHVAVFDRQSGLQLIAYKYLRSISQRIRGQRPATPCTQAVHKQRQPGTGQFVTSQTRDGSLDKLYQPNKLGQAYAQAAQLGPITDDGLPLKVELGRLVKMPLMSNAVPIPVL